MPTPSQAHFAELLLAAKLRAPRDTLRARSDFSEDIQAVNAVLHNPKVKKVSKLAAYREWLRKNQPCVFGRAAATNKQVFICMLEEQQILLMKRGDDDLRETIRDQSYPTIEEDVMVMLTYQDLLELLRIVPTKRHQLEILGYEHSTRGARQFRQDRPDYLPQAYRLIEQSLEETGSFPRNPHPGVECVGSLLQIRPDGRITFFSSAEISVFESIRTRCDFGSVQEAIYEVLRTTVDRAYLRVPPPSEPLMHRRVKPDDAAASQQGLESQVDTRPAPDGLKGSG